MCINLRRFRIAIAVEFLRLSLYYTKSVYDPHLLFVLFNRTIPSHFCNSLKVNISIRTHVRNLNLFLMPSIFYDYVLGITCQDNFMQLLFAFKAP